MKIGQFAAKHQTSIDTLRHYMSMGLLFPEKNGVQYDFDDNCSQDFLQVTELKKIGFTLSEIQVLILYKRIGKLTEYDQRSTYTSFFEKKYHQIEMEIEKLLAMKSNLRTAIDEMKSNMDADSHTPVTSLDLSLDAMSLLACPACHSTYTISKGSIQNGALSDATLTCSCAQHLYVKEGIVYTEETFTAEQELSLDFNIHQYSEDYIDEYIRTTHIDYLRKLHAGLSWSARQLAKEDLDGMVALELGTGHGYFMRHMIDLFPANSTYVAVDYNPIKLKWLKQILERSQPKCNIIFLCADFKHLPVKQGIVDVLLDISGSSNFAFDHADFLLDHIETLMKSTSVLHGYYILFDSFAKQSKIPPLFRDNFKLKPIQQHLKRLGYHVEEDFVSEPVDHGGPLEDYFVEGESVRTYLYRGIKSSKP